MALRQQIGITYRLARKIVVLVIGLTVVAVGIVMIVTPGPAIVVIPAGLAILGLEFAWARRLLAKMKEKTQSALAPLRSVSRKGPKETTESD